MFIILRIAFVAHVAARRSIADADQSVTVLADGNLQAGSSNDHLHFRAATGDPSQPEPGSSNRQKPPASENASAGPGSALEEAQRLTAAPVDPDWMHLLRTVRIEVYPDSEFNTTDFTLTNVTS